MIARAKRLDDLRMKRVAEKLTLDEADRIVHIFGAYLEHSGAVRYLFGGSIPGSLLPYPIGIIQGALNKMEEYYHKRGMHDRVRLLEAAESALPQYAEDREAIEATLNLFNRGIGKRLLSLPSRTIKKSRYSLGTWWTVNFGS